MSDRIKNKIACIGIGNVTTLWNVLVYRVSKDVYMVGHQSIKVAGDGAEYLSIEEAAAKIKRLMD